MQPSASLINQRKQSEVIPLSQREAGIHCILYFVQQRNLTVSSGTFSAQLNDLFGTFHKKENSADTFSI